MHNQDHQQDSPLLPRRRLLRGGALGLGALAASTPGLAHGGPGVVPVGGAHGEDLDIAYDLFASTCTLTPSDVQGPFWIDLSLLRQDITEGLQGFPVSLFLQIVEAGTCLPISGAVVDIWHDDPLGAYSGFASQGTAGQTYLRGIQVTGMDGIVRFDTIYPGWYPGRTPHLHMRLNPNAGQELTTQLYLDDDISDRVFRLVSPYDTRGPSPVTNQTDPFYIPELESAMQFQSGVNGVVVGKRIAIS